MKETVKEQVMLAKSITQEWGDFTAEILYHSGHPGIAGRLDVLFRSMTNDQSFIMLFGVCDLIETRFRWQIECIEIDFDDILKQVIVTDLSKEFRIHADSLRIYELSSNAAFLQLYIQILSYRDLQSIPPDFQRLNSFSQVEDDIGNELSVCDFEICSNLMSISTTSYIKDGKDVFGASFMLLRNPTYFYFKRKRFTLKEFTIQESEQTVRLINIIDGSLLIECSEIQMCESSERDSYNNSIPNFRNWWKDTISIASNLDMTPQKNIPQQVVSIWPF